MRQDAGVDGDARRISPLVWPIFLKLFDAAERWLATRPGHGDDNR
jgi:type I restriction enzyme M protein